MKILMVSWEYPPVVIGGLGRHVHHLATALADAGHEVVVLSRRPSGTDPSTPPVDRRGQRGRAGDRRRAGSARVRLRHRHDGVDAGDGSCDDPRRAGAEERPQPAWRPTSCTPTTGWSPIPRSHSPNTSTCQWFPPFTRPRRAGIPAGCRARSAGRCTRVESWLVRESDSLITCSASMSDEITELFGPGLAETRVIRNGIDAARWPFAQRRPRTGPGPAAVPRAAGVREGHARRHRRAAADQAHPSRDHADHRRRRAPSRSGSSSRPESTRCSRRRGSSATSTTTSCSALLHDADAAVLPSHYEPFGIVALEAAATGTPLVTSNVGGLGEAVINGQTGMSFPPRDIAGAGRGRARRARRSRCRPAHGRGRPRTAHIGLRLGTPSPTRPHRCIGGQTR